MLVEVFVLLLGILVYAIIKDRKPSTMPPGPSEIPFFGQVPSLKISVLEGLRAKFGDLVTTRTGVLRTVFMYDFKVAKEVMARQEFSDRPTYFSDFMVDDQKTGGVAMSNGAQWLHDRRFMIRNLRNFGMGKTYLEGAMNIEAQALVEDLKMYEGKPINFPDSLRTAALNVIWQMMASRRYDLRSPDIDAIYQATKDLYNEAGVWFMLHAWFPILKSLPLPHFIQEKLFSTSLGKNYTESIRKVVNEAIDEHEKNFDSNNLRDLIDEYLHEMKTAEEKEEPHYFRKGALCQIIGDGFDAGSDTVSMSMKWVVIYLACYPEMARRLQKQLDDAVPRDQQVTSQDKEKLPLIESFVVEMFRHSSFASVGFERMASKDTNISGYLVPKGTLVKSVAMAMHYNPETFPDPTEFKVDRFIDENGEFHAPKEGFTLFGSGRRACPGENLARAEVFLFTCAILQNFDILLPEGVTVDLNELGEGVEFGIRLPKNIKLIYKARE